MQRGVLKRRDSIILKFYSLNFFFFFRIGTFISEDHRASNLRGRKILTLLRYNNLYVPNNLFYINFLNVVPEV